MMKYFKFLSLCTLSLALFATESKGADQKINPLSSSLPQIQEDKGVSLSIGLTYQSMLMNSYAPVVSMTSNETIYKFNYLYSKPIKNFEIDAAIGYREKQGSYDIKITNQYFDGSSTSKFKIQDLDASSNTSLAYDFIGLELAENFFINRRFSLRLIGGLLGTLVWMNQSNYYRVHDYEGQLNINIFSKQTQYGVGPQFGANGECKLYNKFGLFVDSQAALLYGNYKNRTEYKRGISDYFYMNNFKSIFPYLHGIIGLSYKSSFDNDRDFIQVKLGYDVKCLLGLSQGSEPNIAMFFNIPFDLIANIRYEPVFSQGLLFDFSWSF